MNLDKHNKSNNLKNTKGFTLVEVLISMVVLALVLTSISMMNFSSITSYTSSRDTTEASLLAEKVISFLQAESEQWKPQPGQTKPATDYQPLFTPGASGQLSQGFIKKSLLSTIAKAPNQEWVSLVNQQPVSSTDVVKTGTTDVISGRFCVAARHIDFPASSNTSKINAIRVQIAIYYPGPSQKGITACTSLTQGNLQNLSRGTYPGEYLLGELGTRTEFFSTILTPPNPAL